MASTFALTQEEYEALAAFARRGAETQDDSVRLNSFLKTLERKAGFESSLVWVQWQESDQPLPTTTRFPGKWPPQLREKIEFMTRAVTRADVDRLLAAKARSPVNILVTRDPGATYGWTPLASYTFPPRPVLPPPADEDDTEVPSDMTTLAVDNITELLALVNFGEEGTYRFVKDHYEPWYWFEALPAGVLPSTDGSTGSAGPASGGYWVGLSTLLAVVDLGGFESVARGSGKRLLDVPLSTLLMLDHGTVTRVKTTNGWFWDAYFPSGNATDNSTSCRPTAWIATGNPGAFVRDQEGDARARAQAAWFIDSSAADNEGDGSALDPVRDDLEIQRRWGLTTPTRISVPVTITYAQSPAGQTNFNFDDLSGGLVTFVGAPTISKAGTVLTAVQTQVRTAGAEAAWAITAVGLGATEVGKLAVITASGTPANVGAYAAVLKDEGGGKVRVAPFGTQNLATPQTFTLITPQVGDVIEIRDPSAVTLSIGRIDVTAFQNDSSLSGSSRVIFDSIKLDGTSNATGMINSNGLGVFYFRSVLSNLNLGGIGGEIATPHQVNGGIVVNAGIIARGTVVFRQTGFLNTNLQARATGVLTILTDTYFQDSGCTANIGGIVQTTGAAFFDRSSSNSAALVQNYGFWQQSGSVPDWGTNNTGHGTTVSSCSSYVYAAKPTINSGLGAGREARIGGTDKFYANIPYIEPSNNAALVVLDVPDPSALFSFSYANIAALKAITSARVGTLQDGEQVYVTTLRAWFAWEALSTVADDAVDFLSVAVTSNGVNPGRFRRLDWAHPAWREQATWFVSTAGSNENSGLTSLAPVKTDVEIQRRWGLGQRVRLPVAVTINYAQAPVTQTNFNVETASTLTLVGTPIVTNAGTVLTAVQTQVRTAGSEAAWAITGVGLGATEVGKLAVITAGTAGNIGAYAAVLKDEGSGKLRVSPFGKLSSSSSLPFTQVTPLVGDTIEIRDPTPLLVGNIEVHSATNDSLSGVTFTSYFMTDGLRLQGDDNDGNGGIVINKIAALYVRSAIDALSLAGTVGSLSTHRLVGGLVHNLSPSFGVVVRGGASVQFHQTGFLASISVSPAGNAALEADCYFQNADGTFGRGSNVNTKGIAHFDRSVSDAGFVVASSGCVTQTGGVGDWGTSNAGHGIVVFSSGTYNYVTKPTINSGLGAGRELLIGSTDKLYSAVPYIEPANNAAVVLNAGATDGSAVFYSAYANITALKAITAARLAGLQDGQRVYVTTLKAWFAWEALSTVADDATDYLSVSITANGASAGRFRRLIWAHPSWREQTAWFVSTSGSNENDGLTSGTPVKTDAEIQRRWGLSDRVRLNAVITITYLQSPTTTTNFYVELLNGAQLNLVGTPTVTKAGTVLTAVQTQVRTAGSELAWAITAVGLGATEVGKIAVITNSGTPGNIGAYAGVLKDETGGKVRVSPFISVVYTTAISTQVTPLVGDTIEIRDMSATTLTVGTFEVRSASDQGISGTNALTYVAFKKLRLKSCLLTPSQFVGGIDSFRVSMWYEQCVYDGILLSGRPSGLGIGQHLLLGGVAGGTEVTSYALRGGAVAGTRQVGHIVAPSVSVGSSITFQVDTYFQNCGIVAGRGIQIGTLGAAFFDRVTSDAAIGVGQGGVWQQAGATPDWGTNNAGHGITISSGSQYLYATKPTVNSGLGAGREVAVGGSDKRLTAVPYVEPSNNAAIVDVVSTTASSDPPLSYYATFASITTLKAITLAQLSNLRDGQQVFVLTLKAMFAWDATSAVADDTTDYLSVAVTSNGAAAGRFRRLAWAHPAWREQATWFVSTAGSNENDGLTSGTAVKSDLEIVRRWGLGQVTLGVPITITYLQSPTTTTNFDVAYVDGGSLSLIGTPTVTKAGTVLTAVQVQVRTPGSELGWAITAVGLGATEVGKIAVITAGTAGNITAYAAVLKDEGGGKVRVSPFGKGDVTGAFSQVTPIVGDTIEIRDMTTVLKVGYINVRGNSQLGAVLSPVQNVVVFDSLLVDGSVSASLNGGIIRNEAAAIAYVRCNLQDLILVSAPSSFSKLQNVCGGLVSVGLGGVDLRGNITLRQTGILNTIISVTGPFGGQSVISVDTYFQNSQLNVNAGCTLNDQGAAFFDKASATSAYTLGVAVNGMACHVRATGGVGAWGTANAGYGMRISASSSYIYATKPTVNQGLGTGREVLVGGTDKLWSAVPYLEPGCNALITAGDSTDGSAVFYQTYANVAALKAITANRLAGLGSGQRVFVTTLKSWFAWDATSAVADDATDFLSVAVTANGASAGRFIRLPDGHPSWLTQTAWFVSTAGSNENDGLTLGTAVKTDTEIQRRWGGLDKRPVISVVVVITYAQTPAGATNFLFETVAGGQVRLVGTPTVSKAGTVLTAVQVQVRTAGSELGWAITGVGLGATEVGKIAVITASGIGANVGAYAMVVKDEGGGKLRVCPFGTPNESTTVFTIQTPQVGDTIEIRDVTATTLKVGKIEVHALLDNLVTPVNVVTDSIALGQSAVNGGGVHSNGGVVLYLKTINQNMSWSGTHGPAASVHSQLGGGVTGAAGLQIRCRGSLTAIGVLTSSVSARSFSDAFIGPDCYFQNSGLTVQLGGIVSGQGSAFFDRATTDSSLFVTEGGYYHHLGAVPDWGTANAGHGIVVQSGAYYGYATKPTINSGLGAGREAFIGGTDKLYTAVPYIETANNAALVVTSTAAPTDLPLYYYQTFANIAALKAITTAQLSNLLNGQRVFVTTLKGWFAWDATSTVADDVTDYLSVSVTANGVAAGRFRRLANAHPAWREQAAWFVNSSTGSNENDGLGSGTAVKTDVEIQRRWGLGQRARLTTDVTITYAQAPATQTNFNVETALSFTLVGTSTISKAGTVLTAVQAQVRTAGSELGWAITAVGLGATEVGKIAVITAGTAGNIGAYAAVLKDETGGKLRVSPFGKFSVANVSAPFTQVTPIVGDTIEIRDPMTLTIGTIEVHSTTSDSLNVAAATNYFTTDGIRVLGDDNDGNGGIVLGRVVGFYVRGAIDAMSFAGSPGSLSIHRLVGGLVSNVSASFGMVARGGTTVTLHQVGVLTSSIAVAPGGQVIATADTYFQNSSLTLGRGMVANTQGAAFFDRSVSNGAIATTPGGLVQQSGGVADWGTANTGHGITVQSASNYVYATKPTINSGLGAGREAQIGGTDKLYSAVPFIEPANNAALVLNA